MKIALFGGIALACFSSVVCAQTVSPQEFVNKAAVSNMFEIDSSKVALERAKSQEVKTFAQQMIDDHTKAGEELKQTVSKIGSGPVPETLDAGHKADLSALSNKSGADFDRAYSLAQRKAHDDAVTLFSAFADSGAQADLKAFAAKTLPTLKMHQEHAKALTAAAEPASMGKPEASNSTGSAEGANSFTEAQARKRIEEAGYTAVTGLAKDDKGVWRGKANKGGSEVNVGLDFKGHVVTE